MKKKMNMKIKKNEEEIEKQSPPIKKGKLS